ncbi:MAG: hypothetical protein IKO44_02695 [Ruminococcus sp.]|nr:hypothetical protein [Ruminococcus sp.]
MKKSVYSIVLADDVVEAVDEMAYSLGTSRSNLINQILAERVSLMTPEMRMKDIFAQIEKLLSPRPHTVAQSSGAAIMIKSPLKYKYRPTVNYSVELSRTFSGEVGRLKISLRTQSVALIEMVARFFGLWTRLESKYLDSLFTNGVPWSGSGASYVRTFFSPNNAALSDNDIAQAIGGYINLLDECIRLCFDNAAEPERTEKEIEKRYKDYLKKGVIIL